MNRIQQCIIALCCTLAIATVAMAGPPVEIKLKDGSRWRGEAGEQVELTYLEQYVQVDFAGELVRVADLYIIVEGDIAGRTRQKTIFRDDIITMKTVTGLPSAKSSPRRPAADKRQPAGAGAKATNSDVPQTSDGRPLGVIVLPLEGSVGTSFRRDEIKMVGEKADELGPGQIIVLLINSNGGSALESQYIADEIFALRERHRVVAWIQKAISAGCQTAMCCQEIYFMTEGTAGAVTTWNPGTGQSIKGEDLERSMEHLVEIAKKSGYSEHIARSMKTNKAICSYDKDPETGEVTFYGDLTGEHVLSTGDQNLSFTSSTALDCGFSKGTADTEEELARLLDLPRWHEVTDYGRRIAKSWQDTCKRAEEEIPRLIAQRGYKNASGDMVSRLGTLIQINNKLIRWWDRAPNIAQGMLPPKEVLERENTEYRKQIADIRRGGG